MQDLVRRVTCGHLLVNTRQPQYFRPGDHGQAPDQSQEYSPKRSPVAEL